MSEGLAPRPKLTTLDKLKIVTRFCRCQGCGQRLGDLKDIEFDHQHARCLGGSDELDNFVPLHKACHAIKTRGTPATTAGSDIHVLAKSRRLTKEQIEFRLRLSAKGPGNPPPKRGKIPSRPFNSKGKRVWPIRLTAEGELVAGQGGAER